ncbi:MAG: metal-dependent transcriptional regulator, partial [Bacteroidota bacterium]
MPTPTAENYLKALFNLAEIEGKASLTNLAQRLGVSAPTANSMIKKLHERGLVAYEKYQPIQLTPSGRKEAALIIRKHRLTEMYLVEKMGFSWDQVHEIAEQMEHLQAPAFFERMDEILGRPAIDPHGSPIPGKDGEIAHHHAYRRLSECAIGESVVLSAVIETTDDFLRLLTSRGIKLGTRFEILEKEEFDGSLKVCYGDKPSEILS